MVSVRPRTADLEELGRLLEHGTLRPQIDRVFPFDEAREAVRYVEDRRAHGRVVITLGDRRGASLRSVGSGWGTRCHAA